MKDDKYFMLQALLEAKRAQEQGEIPIGAIVVENNKILSRGFNTSLQKNDPTAHAEIVAIRDACEKKGNFRIPECDLYVTVEPCAMCLGAAVQARISRLIFGALDPKAGALESIIRFPFDRTNHSIEVKGGVMAKECGQILKDFFKDKR